MFWRIQDMWPGMEVKTDGLPLPHKSGPKDTIPTAKVFRPEWVRIMAGPPLSPRQVSRPWCPLRQNWSAEEMATGRFWFW